MPLDDENQEAATSESVLRDLLDRDWREADVRRAAALAAALDACPEALAAVREADAIREALHVPVSTEVVEPTGGWEAFEARMHDALSRQINRPPELTPELTPEFTPELAPKSTPQSAPASIPECPPALSPAAPAAQAEVHAAADGPGAPGSTMRFRITRMHAAIAASVALLLGIGIGHLATRSVPVDPLAGLTTSVMTGIDPDSLRVPAELSIPSAEETNRQVAAFHEVARTLDHRASWMTLSGTPQVGLTSAPLAADIRPLLVRLVAFRNGRTVAEHDIVIIAGQEAELKAPLDHGEIRYVITTRDSDPIQVSLWSELVEPGRSPQVLAALATHIHARPGDVRSVGEMVSTSGEYRIQLGIHESNRNTGRTHEPFREAAP